MKEPRIVRVSVFASASLDEAMRAFKDSFASKYGHFYCHFEHVDSVRSQLATQCLAFGGTHCRYGEFAVRKVELEAEVAGAAGRKRGVPRFACRSPTTILSPCGLGERVRAREYQGGRESQTAEVRFTLPAPIWYTTNKAQGIPCQPMLRNECCTGCRLAEGW